jgi:coenzyme F420-0:L-glutamate ligase/coenzyme F420-1:gamma-L-glutamate ligase
VTAELRVFAIPNLAEATHGLDAGRAIADAVAAAAIGLDAGDVIVVAQKFVSKAEGAVVALADISPSPRAREWATAYGKDAAVVEVVLRESRRIVRMERGVLIAETRHGLVCANAGVDASNVPSGYVTVLPQDPDASAARIRRSLAERHAVDIGVIVSDTFGRPWREGAVNVAIGVAGLQPMMDYRGQVDQFGRRLQSTVIAIADEIASAAELVMGKAARTPAAVVRGAREWMGNGSAATLVRPAAADLFR